jgi:hypothetical protein
MVTDKIIQSYQVKNELFNCKNGTLYVQDSEVLRHGIRLSLGTRFELSIMKVNLRGHKLHSLANSRYSGRR